MIHRINWRATLAALPLPMLALAASFGVYEFALLFVPAWVAFVQAASFELTYIGLAVLQGLDDRQRRRAALISVGAVVTSIIYNTLAGWFHRQPGLLVSASPIADLMLAILHGAPLAWVAFLVSDLLLHRHESATAARADRAETRQGAPAQPWAPAPADDSALRHIAPDLFDADDAQAAHAETHEPPPASRTYTCRHCGAIALTASELMAHGRRYKRWGDCDGQLVSAAD